MGNFFGVRLLGSSLSPFLWTSVQRAFLKGPEVMPSSNASSSPEMFRRWVPASTSFRDILGSFISQALPNGTVTAGQFRSTDGMVRGRECRFLLFRLCGVYSLEMYDIKVFVTEKGSSFYFVAWTVKPQNQVLDISWAYCARSTNLGLHIFGLSAVQRKRKRDTVNKYVYVGDDVC